MTEDRKKSLHPIVARALEMAYEGIEPIEFDDYAVEQLQDMLREYRKQDLVEAVIELLRLFAILKEEGCTSASLKILLVIISAADAFKKGKTQ
jgi:hypothetical protein